MANGILKDEATYFNDNETYTGDSGSETNKYVIEDVYDFVAIGISDESKNYRLVNDIDFRDHPTYKTGFYNLRVARDQKGTFDGDGHAIKNIGLNDYSNVSFMYFGEIINVDFINLIINNCSYAYSLINGWNVIDGYGMLKNCNFGIYIANSNAATLPFKDCKTEDCCFNVKGRISDGTYVTIAEDSKRTHINVDLIMSHTQIFGIYENDKAITNCYITGKIKNLTTLSKSTAILTGKLSNSYIAVEYEGDSDYSGIRISGTGFIDKELWCKNGFTGLDENPTSSYIRPITTAQAQNADYLNSIEFAVMPV